MKRNFLLPKNLREAITKKINNPSGFWKDFNKDHKCYKELKIFAQMGMVEKDEVIEPNPSDYPNLNGN